MAVCRKIPSRPHLRHHATAIAIDGQIPWQGICRVFVAVFLQNHAHMPTQNPELAMGKDMTMAVGFQRGITQADDPVLPITLGQPGNLIARHLGV